MGKEKREGEEKQGSTQQLGGRKQLLKETDRPKSPACCTDLHKMTNGLGICFPDSSAAI